MANSFLQYCAMCEKQIMTPSNSILYCSQACRRKDDAKPLSASILPPMEAPRSTTSSRNGSRSSSPKPATAVSRTGSPTPTIRIPSELHAHKAAIDPTEWKPKLRGVHTRRSEAYRYLASFHARMGQDGDWEQSGGSGRPMHKHSTSMYNIPTMTMTPSLDSTATTVASSFESFEYDFHTRPLQARQNPMYALSTCLKNDDLVTPVVPPPVIATLEPLVSDDVLWEKKIVVKRAGAGQDGLGRLIGGDAA